jgi:hypothetical protein
MEAKKDADLKNDLGLNDDASVDMEAPEPVKPKKAQPKVDPERDKKNWPEIMIEMESGKPNYEFLSAHGTDQEGRPFGHDLQVMRGVPVKVPPSVYNMLKESVADHYIQVRDPDTGRNKMIRQERSTVPWRPVNPGKYCR